MQTQRAQGRLALFELPKTSKSSMNIIENFENIFKHKLIAARRKIVCNLHDSSDWPDCCVGFIRNWSSTVGPLFIISLKYFLLVDTRVRLLEIWDKIFYTSRPSEVLSNIPAVTWCSLWLLLLTVLSKGSHQSRKKSVKNEGVHQGDLPIFKAPTVQEADHLLLIL